MFRPYRAIIRPYYNNRFIHIQYILGSQIVYKGGIMLQCCVLLLRLKMINLTIAHSTVTLYHLCKQFGIPKYTGCEWTGSYSKAWWWPETCRLVCTFNSGVCGLEVACWPLVPKFAGSQPAEAVGFLGRKNPQHAFLRWGSKAVGPMS